MSIQPKSVVSVFVRNRESCSHQDRGEFALALMMCRLVRIVANYFNRSKQTGGKQRRVAL